MIDYSRFPDIVISNDESVAVPFMNFLARRDRVLKTIAFDGELRYLCSYGAELIWYTPAKFMKLVGWHFDQVWIDYNVDMTDDLKIHAFAAVSDIEKIKVFNEPEPTLIKQTFHRNLKGE